MAEGDGTPGCGTAPPLRQHVGTSPELAAAECPAPTSAIFVAFLFAVTLLSGIWIGTLRWCSAEVMVFLGVAAICAAFPVALDRAPSRATTPLPRDGWLTAAAMAPGALMLAATWSQEFPYNGDQSLHNGLGVEAWTFWRWSWPAAVAALLLVVARARPGERSWVPLAGCVSLFVGGALWHEPAAFAGRYPGILHALAVPLRVVAATGSMPATDVERLLNLLAIPGWLLLLRPLLLGRRVDAFASAVAALFFWQKDSVYYWTSAYLEPWAVVLLLTAAEHLVRFGSRATWRPLLLVGAASMVKEQSILSLPFIAAVSFPWRGGRRDQYRHLLASAVAAMPLLLFVRTRSLFKVWGGALPAAAGGLFRIERLSTFFERVRVEFGGALPIVVGASLLLVLFAIRGPHRRAFAALALAASADAAFFFTAASQQHWTGYPRTNLVPFAYAAIAFGVAVESLYRRHRAGAAGLLLLAFLLNVIALVPFLRLGFARDSARNFLEHDDAAIFYPLREGLTRGVDAGLLRRGESVVLLNNGKQLYPQFYPGPVAEQYSDLAPQFALHVESFRGMSWRCRCRDGAATLALFVRFTNLGAHVAARNGTESEAEECRRALRASCSRTMTIRHDGVIVGMLGRTRSQAKQQDEGERSILPTR